MSGRKSFIFTLMMIFSMILWGGGWVSGKIIADSFAADVLIFWRFLITVFSMIPLFLIIGVSFKIHVSALKVILPGALFLTIYNQLFFRGLVLGFAGAGGVLVTSLVPLCTFFITSMLFRHHMNYREITGLVLGFVGGLVLLRIWELDSDLIFKSGNLFFVLAAFSWAFLTISSNKSLSFMSTLSYSFYIHLVAVLFSFVIVVPRYNLSEFFVSDPVVWLNLVYLSVGCTTFATTAYFYATRKLGSGKASSFIFLVPLCALVLSWIILGEVPAFNTLLGGGIAVGAVYIINSKGAFFKKIQILNRKRYS